MIQSYLKNRQLGGFHWRIVADENRNSEVFIKKSWKKSWKRENLWKNSLKSVRTEVSGRHVRVDDKDILEKKHG
jgi:hypothetical protein